MNPIPSRAFWVITKNLKFAKKDVEFALKTEETKFQDFLQIILVNSNHEEKIHLTNFIKESTTKIHRKEKEKYQKKLKHLQLKYNIPIDNESRIQGFEKVKSKSRRFIISSIQHE